MSVHLLIICLSILTVKPLLSGIKCEDSNADLVSAGNISGEEQFYPYEISGDVEMMSQDEFNFEEVKQSDFGDLKTEAFKDSERLNGEAAKLRKILVRLVKLILAL